MGAIVEASGEAIPGEECTSEVGGSAGSLPAPSLSVQLGMLEHHRPCSSRWVAAGLTHIWVIPLCP